MSCLSVAAAVSADRLLHGMQWQNLLGKYLADFALETDELWYQPALDRVEIDRAGT
jgi:hypothetical protein